MATTENSSGERTFTATNAAIPYAIRVKVDSNGKISAAGANDAWIGVTKEKIAADGSGSVKLRNAPGTFIVTASNAVTRGNRLLPTANGKVDDATGTGVYTGLIALEAATADGDQIEAAPADDLTFTADADQGSLTHGVGTADGTVDDVGGSFNQTTLNNNFKELTTRINALRTAVVNAGIAKGAA